MLTFCRTLVSRVNMKNIPKNILQIWRTADAVCLDVDSTVITSEGLDDLADFCGCGEEVAMWTSKAMGEGISFREALTARLNIFKPSKQKMLKQLVDHLEVNSLGVSVDVDNDSFKEKCERKLQDFMKERPPTLTKNVKELVSLLTSRGAIVYLVSGGLHTIVDHVANQLDIPLDRVFANRLIHNEKGEYIGFDENEPTSASHGKAKVAEQLKTKYKYKSMVMIGDGITDFEAYPPADLFIGFGGNKMRQNVYDKAPWFVYSFQELLDALED